MAFGLLFFDHFSVHLILTAQNGSPSPHMLLVPFSSETFLVYYFKTDLQPCELRY